MAIRLTGLASGLDTDSMVQELVSAYSTKLESYKKDKTMIEWTQEKWSDLNTKIYGFYTGSLSSLRMVSSFANKKNVAVSDPTKAMVTADSSVANGTQTLEVKQLAKAGYLTGSKITTSDGGTISASTKLSELGVSAGTMSLTVGGENKDVEITSDMTVSEFVSALKNQGLNANFDTTQQRFFVSASTSGLDADFSFETGDADGLANLKALGLATADDDPDGTAVKQAGQNAIIELNGATFEGNSNQFTINGLSITATGVTDGVISISTSTDTEGIYDMIKGFFTDYNNIINELTADYNAESAKDYEPLSDDEKDAMSDTEIENWENKIKTALLRRDDTLNSIISAMNTAMQQGITINGKTYNLSSFGIQTQSIISAASNTQNAFHIAGNPDDSVSSDSTDKLKVMIASDPDTVTEFFTQLAKNLYSSLTTKMQSTTLSSAYTIYNDKSLKEDLSDIEDTIDEWEEKVSDYEEKWYEKFASMETALSQLQSSTSSLTALLGG